MLLHMDAYLRAKFEVSSIILTSFRQGVILPPSPPQNEPLKSPPRLGLIWKIHFLFKCDLNSYLASILGRETGKFIVCFEKGLLFDFRKLFFCSGRIRKKTTWPFSWATSPKNSYIYRTKTWGLFFQICYCAPSSDLLRFLSWLESDNDQESLVSLCRSYWNCLGIVI